MNYRSSHFFDVSHTVRNGMITYKGFPAPFICDYLRREASRKHYSEGTEFQIGKIEMVANTGTYIDSPFHRYAHGKYLSQLPLTSLVGIDSYNIDDTADGARPAHTVLLGNDIPIVEHMTNLESLPDSGFRFFTVLVKIQAFGSFSVRAFGIVNKL